MMLDQWGKVVEFIEVVMGLCYQVVSGYLVREVNCIFEFYQMVVMSLVCLIVYYDVLGMFNFFQYEQLWCVYVSE